MLKVEAPHKPPGQQEREDRTSQGHASRRRTSSNDEKSGRMGNPFLTLRMILPARAPSTPLEVMWRAGSKRSDIGLNGKGEIEGGEGFPSRPTGQGSFAGPA